jgi:hypothetical protein
MASEPRGHHAATRGAATELNQGVELNCESHEIARNRAAFHRFNRRVCGDGASRRRELNRGTWHRGPEFFGSGR